ncbi:thiamine biosynthesis protein ThiF [Luteipulveratus mongoliensis]|uniref:Thiamine biosynthesis protein ThiF n=1 Tax=Luteipulveratus mongoliensis TaxID=571913 RepID=A0A0K1JR58_9MICO|nr:thiamine biosynthesis protein ThiF [Luteipulveratus mongoliensis]
MIPSLKSVVWERDGSQLRLMYDIRDQFVIADPDGQLETLLVHLREGRLTVAELSEALSVGERSVSPHEVREAITVLDAHGLVESVASESEDASDRERYHSNLAFFESFASLERGRADFQQALRESHVLVLGTGGLNSNTIPHLCGLGVGRLTLLDKDVVELRNFARQYLYRYSDIGLPKVDVAADWVRAFDPSIKVETISTELSGAADIGDVLDAVGPDVVMSGVDSPSEIDDWVNAACVSRSVPYVRGGMFVTTGLVWSVDPGASACRECLTSSPDELDAEERTADALFRTGERTNRGIGPVAGLLGSLCAFEVLRYLTRFEAPAYAGRPNVIDFAHGCAVREFEWKRNPACTVCAPTARPAKRGR